MVEHPSSASQYHDIMRKAGGKLVVVDFSATWCGPCQQIKPFFESLPSKYPQVVFVGCDVDKLRDLDEVQSVHGVPTFRFWKAGKKLADFSGANQQKIIQVIEEHKGPVNAFSGKGNALGDQSTSSGASSPSSTSQSTIGPPMAEMQGSSFLVQARLQSGVVHQIVSSDSDTLSDFEGKLKNVMKTKKKLEIAQPFPRYIFQAADYSKTLIELKLKNATVVVKEV